MQNNHVIYSDQKQWEPSKVPCLNSMRNYLYVYSVTICFTIPSIAQITWRRLIQRIHNNKLGTEMRYVLNFQGTKPDRCCVVRLRVYKACLFASHPKLSGHLSFIRIEKLTVNTRKLTGTSTYFFLHEDNMANLLRNCAHSMNVTELSESRFK
jgi:hypothetical protein